MRCNSEIEESMISHMIDQKRKDKNFVYGVDTFGSRHGLCFDTIIDSVETPLIRVACIDINI